MLPCSQFFQLYHCSRWDDTNVWTVDPNGATAAEASAMAERVTEGIRQAADEEEEFDPDLSDEWQTDSH